MEFCLCRRVGVDMSCGGFHSEMSGSGVCKNQIVHHFIFAKSAC